MFGHPGENARCGRHRIRGVEPAARGDGADGKRFVAGHVWTALAGKLPLMAERDKVFLGVFEARFQNAHVLVDDGFALVAEGVGKTPEVVSKSRPKRKISAPTATVFCMTGATGAKGLSN